MTRIYLPKKGYDTCPNCNTVHLLPIQYDEDGGYVQIDTEICNHDTCTRKLCSACPQFKCGICQLTFCAEHGTKFGNTGDILCPVCMEIVRAEAIEVTVIIR